MDIRWQQRFYNFQNALRQLNKALATAKERKLNDLEKQGMVQAFEFTHELAWKVMMDFMKYQGNNEIFGSKDATRAAFKLGLVTEGTQWMEMIDSRNLSSHTYDESTAEAIVLKITSSYGALFVRFEAKMLEIIKNAQTTS